MRVTSPTEIWTQIAGLEVSYAYHYTIKLVELNGFNLDI